MAASAQSTAAVFTDSCKKSLCMELQRQQKQSSLQLPCSSFFHRRLSIRPVISQGLNGSIRSASSVSALNEVAVDGSVNAGAATASKVDPEPKKDNELQDLSAEAQEDAISSVMADVANLLKLVDSRDIVELELKHSDFELVIRKKEALAPLPSPPPPQIMPQVSYSHYAPPPPPPVATPAPTPAPAAQAPASTPAALPAPPASSGSDLPRILSPMAGTFYKCPAPGEPPFVKVGDKVQKGQVICIVEAMKLMNEIEADQSGTVVEILAEDGKPVAVDTPLYLIKP